MNATFTSYSGIVLRHLKTEVLVASPTQSGQNPQTFAAIWDTGATHSSIARSVVAACGL